ncbi:MAG: DUF1570 domain-containing protein [Phycisphaerae bacterium]
MNDRSRISKPARCMMLPTVAILLLSAVSVHAQTMQVVDTPYYTLKTDLPADRAKEAAIRVTKMFEEYQKRTSDFTRTVNRKLLFELHANRDTYVRSTDAPQTLGVYTGQRLVAYYQKNDAVETWHTVQHEGFHQFVDFAMGRDAIPIWANEGLAEYFGESIWTGDRYYSGIIPQKRLERVQKKLKADEFRSLVSMLTMSHAQWNAEGNFNNYDQAWMMVHFLAHADNGKYAGAFGRFLGGARTARSPEAWWISIFGNNVRAFEDRWREYWTNLPVHPTRIEQLEATCSTLTSFYARAFTEKQRYSDWGDFVADASRGLLKCEASEWLPPELLQQALADAKKHGKWSIDKRPGKWFIVCALEDGQRLEGSFKLSRGKVSSVDVALRKAR